MGEMGDTFADWQAEATPDEAIVRVCLNRRLYRRFTDAVDELEAAHEAGHSETLDGADDTGRVEALALRAVDLEEQVRAAEKPLVFTCLPFDEWRALCDAHPATDEQKAANRFADVDDDTFWPAAVAACCTNPGVTVDQAVWLRGFLPRDKWRDVCAAVDQVNMGGSQIPKSVSSIVARLKSGLSSITAPPEGSPSPSSEAESHTLDGPVAG